MHALKEAAFPVPPSPCHTHSAAPLRSPGGVPRPAWRPPPLPGCLHCCSPAWASPSCCACRLSPPPGFGQGHGLVDMWMWWGTRESPHPRVFSGRWLCPGGGLNHLPFPPSNPRGGPGSSCNQKEYSLALCTGEDDFFLVYVWSSFQKLCENTIFGLFNPQKLSVLCRGGEGATPLSFNIPPPLCPSTSLYHTHFLCVSLSHSRPRLVPCHRDGTRTSSAAVHAPAQRGARHPKAGPPPPSMTLRRPHAPALNAKPGGEEAVCSALLSPWQEAAEVDSRSWRGEPGAEGGAGDTDGGAVR